MQSELQTRRTHAVSGIISVLLGLIALAGCGPAVMNLTYPPEPYVNEEISEFLGEALLPQSSRTIDVYVFDARTDKSSPVYGSAAFVTESDEEVRNWVIAALRYELVNAGYAVSIVDEYPAADSITRLTADVQMILWESNRKDGARVLLQGTLEQIDTPVLVNQYEGISKVVGSTAGGVAKSLSHALEDAVRQMIVDMELVQPL